MKPLLAKSIDQGNLTLFDHTLHVTQAIEHMSFHLSPIHGFDVSLAKKGAILHDLGKSHPFFQKVVSDQLTEADLAENTACPHRHEISSILFLPLFPKEEWDVLIEMVIGHHKSVQHDRRERGLLDLVEKIIGGEETVFNRHAQEWETWMPNALLVAKAFDLKTNPISIEEAREAFNYTLNYCENLQTGWSRWRGLLMGADHFASDRMHQTMNAVSRFYEQPDLSYYENRKHNLYPLSLLSASSHKPHTLVIAPTGAGKTDYLLRRCQGRLFYTLPFQASINAMFDRIRHDLPETDIRRVHAASRITVNKDNTLEETHLQRHPGASIKVMTPHQLACLIFGMNGYEAVALDVAEKDVILDEVHVYREESQAMVLEIIKTLKALGCRIHVGTATIPTLLKNHIIDLLGGHEHVLEVTLPDHVLAQFNRHQVYKIATQEQVYDIVEEAVANKERLLIVQNKVLDAQFWFTELKSKYPDIPSMLIHSRFRRKDRAKLEDDIQEFNKTHGPCIVCATQVVEVSLDISFDRMITACAPLDALIQRFGRVNRKRTEQSIGHYKPVHVIAPPEDPKSALPYQKDVLDRSFEALPDQGELLKETELQSLIDRVYPNETFNLVSIDGHLIFQQDQWVIYNLCHHPRTVLMDVLEVESACVIRHKDVGSYRKPGNEFRQNFEIPVTWNSIRHLYGKMPALEGVPENPLKKIGHSPLVIPNDWYSKQVGLQLPKTDPTEPFNMRSI
ncbi:MAG: CRISPR-associated helicase Cas3' [Bacteroidetes Order II. Incertae sedis bacterium]|nr:CRISPR-associated helicase Cas3' [Bacteroidetes Order II. bacterium]